MWAEAEVVVAVARLRLGRVSSVMLSPRRHPKRVRTSLRHGCSGGKASSAARRNAASEAPGRSALASNVEGGEVDISCISGQQRPGLARSRGRSGWVEGVDGPSVLPLSRSQPK